MTVIDLFAGCGGFSTGFIQSGFDVVQAVEFDSQIAAIYRDNHPNVDMIVEDIRNVDQSSVFNENSADIIIGGPPCQGFSMAGARIRAGFIDDPRNYLFKHYFNVVKAVKPKVFVMENVKGLMTMQGGKIFSEIQRIFQEPKLLDGVQYKLYYRVIKADEFGIPQKRERVIILGTRILDIDFEQIWEMTKKDVLFSVPSFFDKINVRDAIGNLPDATHDGIVSNPKAVTNYQKYLASVSNKLMNHNGTNHSDVAIRRMKKIGNGDNYKVLEEQIHSVHSGSYGRMCWEKQAATITTRFDTPAGGRYIHPVKNRTITPREAARIQSFPDDFIFRGNKTTICKTIGNAVPPKIAYFIACFIRRLLNVK